MIEVLVNRAGNVGASAEVVHRAVTDVLSEGGARSAQVSVTFLSDHEMQGLNRSYLGHDWPTDVLSFTLPDDASVNEVGPQGPDLVGDIYIGADRLTEQASERGIAPQEEAVRLAIHGALHLLGRDHPEGADREESDFFAEQEAWVARVLASEAEG